MFSNFERVFHLTSWTTQISHMSLHINPSKYETSGYNLCLKKLGGCGCGSEQVPLKNQFFYSYVIT